MGSNSSAQKPNKTMKLARSIVSSALDVGTLEDIVGQSMPADTYKEICLAVDVDYESREKRLDEIEDETNALDSRAREIIGEFCELYWAQTSTRQTAFFHLGYAAALRLSGSPPPVEPITGGGDRDPKLATKRSRRKAQKQEASGKPPAAKQDSNFEEILTAKLKRLAPDKYFLLRRQVYDSFAKTNPNRDRLGKPGLKIVPDSRSEPTPAHASGPAAN